MRRVDANINSDPIELARTQLDAYLEIRSLGRGDNFYKSVREFYQSSMFHFRRLIMLNAIAKHIKIKETPLRLEHRHKAFRELGKRIGVNPSHWISGLADPTWDQFNKYQYISGLDFDDLQYPRLHVMRFAIIRTIIYIRILPPCKTNLTAADHQGSSLGQTEQEIYDFVRTHKHYKDKKRINHDLLDKIIEKFEELSLTFDDVKKMNKEFAFFTDSAQFINQWYWPFGVFKYSTKSKRFNSKHCSLAGVWIESHDLYDQLWETNVEKS